MAIKKCRLENCCGSYVCKIKQDEDESIEVEYKLDKVINDAKCGDGKKVE